jgi:hypothetical protein
MEDVLDLYEEEYNPCYPTVCLDEKPVVLHADVQPPIPVEPGQPERVDYEYERKGTRNLFVMVEPLAGWRHVEVTAQRTMQDYAKVVRWLVDEVYPQASSIRLVQDNLNTHTPAALYETFPPAEARRILRRLEFHYTPKHGSWLNMAEIEIAILERNALSHRLADEVALRRQVLAVETERNAQQRGICWQFTSCDARRKLERLYPVKQAPATILSASEDAMAAGTTSEVITGQPSASRAAVACGGAEGEGTSKPLVHLVLVE